MRPTSAVDDPRQIANFTPTMTAHSPFSHMQSTPSVSSTVSYPSHPTPIPTDHAAVVIVGHSQCGGAAACFAACAADKSTATTPLARWLEPLTDLARSLHLSTVDAEEALPVLIEENVRRQVENLAKSETVLAAWAEGKGIQIHGWVYDIPSGRLEDLGVSKSAEKPKDV